MLFRCIAVCIMCQLILSCDTHDDHDKAFMPGYLALDNEYDLGEIQNTKQFAFELSNIGGSNVFDASISSSNTSFVLDTEFIQILRPRAENSFIQPVVVTALHGTAPSGIGLADLMPPGENETTLRITGRTTNVYGDTLRLSERAVLRVNALLVDIEVSDVTGIIPLGSPTGSTSGVGDFVSRIRWYQTAPGPIHVRNTGNTDLPIRIYTRTEGVEYDEVDVFVSVGNEIEIDRSTERIILRIDSQNTVSDFNRLPIESNGMIYLAFFKI